MSRSENRIELPLSNQVDRSSTRQQRAVREVMSIAVAIFGGKWSEETILRPADVHEVAALGRRIENISDHQVFCRTRRLAARVQRGEELGRRGAVLIANRAVGDKATVGRL